MSKTTLRKAIAGFSADELRQLLLEVYSKSKEAKEILDFYSAPDIEGKLDEYTDLMCKEVWRIHKYLPAPRFTRIRQTLRRFVRLEPGDEAVGELMFRTVMAMTQIGMFNSLEENQLEQMSKFEYETLIYLKKRSLLDEYAPKLRKALDKMPKGSLGYNWLRNTLRATLENIESGCEE